MNELFAEKQTAIDKLSQSIKENRTEIEGKLDELSEEIDEKIEMAVDGKSEKVKKLIKEQVIIAIGEENIATDDGSVNGEEAVDDAIRIKERDQCMVVNEVKRLFREEMSSENGLEGAVAKMKEDVLRQVAESHARQALDESTATKMKDEILKEVAEARPAAIAFDETTVTKMKEDILKQVAESQVRQALDESTVTKMKDEILKEVAEARPAAVAIDETTVTKMKDAILKEVEEKRPEMNENSVEKMKDDILRQVAETRSFVEVLNGEKDGTDQGQWTEIVRKQVSKVVQQKVDHGKREKNIIIYRVAESDNREAEHEHDQGIIQELFETCQVQVKDYIYKRLGSRETAREEGKVRPILLTFKELTQKIDLFKNLKKLKNAPDHLKSISVNHDLTKVERDETKNLVTKAKEKETEDPLHRYRVRGPPGNQRIVRLPLVEAEG